MSKMAEVFIKNMKIFLRDKKIIFIVFAIPIMLVLVMGFVFSGMSNGNQSFELYHRLYQYGSQ